MAEIKHTFTKGRMNKDLDERLVPNGEYRDAQNIQVRTTDGDAAGTVQNIQGNKLIGSTHGQEQILVNPDFTLGNDGWTDYRQTQSAIRELNDGLTDWTNNSGWTLSGNQATATNSSSTLTFPGLEIGKVYTMTVKNASITSGEFRLKIGSGSYSVYYQPGATELIFTAVCFGDQYARIQGNNGSGTFDTYEISIKEVSILEFYNNKLKLKPFNRVFGVEGPEILTNNSFNSDPSTDWEIVTNINSGNPYEWDNGSIISEVGILKLTQQNLVGVKTSTKYKVKLFGDFSSVGYSSVRVAKETAVLLNNTSSTLEFHVTTGSDLGTHSTFGDSIEFLLIGNDTVTVNHVSVKEIDGAVDVTTLDNNFNTINNVIHAGESYKLNYEVSDVTSGITNLQFYDGAQWVVVSHTVGKHEYEFNARVEGSRNLKLKVDNHAETGFNEGTGVDENVDYIEFNSIELYNTSESVSGSKCVGSVVDDKNDKAYFMFASDEFIQSNPSIVGSETKYIDYIIEQDTNGETVNVVNDVYGIAETALHAGFNDQSLPSGFNSFTVKDASKYRPGMSVMILSDSGKNMLSSNTKISYIVDDTIYLNEVQSTSINDEVLSTTTVDLHNPISQYGPDSHWSNGWSKVYENHDTIITKNSSDQRMKIQSSSAGAWEAAYFTFQAIKGQSYEITFDIETPSSNTKPVYLRSSGGSKPNIHFVHEGHLGIKFESNTSLTSQKASFEATDNEMHVHFMVNQLAGEYCLVGNLSIHEIPNVNDTGVSGSKINRKGAEIADDGHFTKHSTSTRTGVSGIEFDSWSISDMNGDPNNGSFTLESIPRGYKQTIIIPPQPNRTWAQRLKQKVDIEQDSTPGTNHYMLEFEVRGSGNFDFRALVGGTTGTHNNLLYNLTTTTKFKKHQATFVAEYGDDEGVGDEQFIILYRTDVGSVDDWVEVRNVKLVPVFLDWKVYPNAEAGTDKSDVIKLVEDKMVFNAMPLGLGNRITHGDGIQANKRYLIKYKVSDTSVNASFTSLNYYDGSVYQKIPHAVGEHEILFKATNNYDLFLRANGESGSNITIDYISLIDADTSPKYMTCKAPRVLNFDQNNYISGVNVIDEFLAWTDGVTEPKKINIRRCIAGTKGTKNQTELYVDTPSGLKQASLALSKDSKNLLVGVQSNFNSTNYTGWLADSDVTLQSTGGRFRVTGDGSHYVYLVDSYRPTVNRNSVYKVQSNVYMGTSSFVKIWTNQSGYSDAIYTDGILSTSFKSNNTEDLQIRFYVYGVDGCYAELDNISLLEVDSDGVIYLEEENITVIKKSPKSAPHISYIDSKGFGKSTERVNNYGGFFKDGAALPNNSTGEVTITSGFCEQGDLLHFTSNIDKTNEVNVDLVVTSVSGTNVKYTVVSTDTRMVEEHLSWKVTKNLSKSLFEDKFCRFALRYKYNDNEYSAFSPWSEIAFKPGDFSYDSTFGYNSGMVNDIKKLTISNVVQASTPKDVKSIDLLFKDTLSPNVYIVKTLNRDLDNEWVTDEVHINSENMHEVVESNQILRAWDNVPKYAKAQEVVGNRLVYGNYSQGYDLPFIPSLEQYIVSETLPSGFGSKSIKSMRDYKVGVVYSDEYGRETPVVSVGNRSYNDTLSGDSLTIGKDKSSKSNKITVRQNWSNVDNETKSPESWMSSAKYYVKSSGNDYHNLVMDRWYDADDGNMWLSFLSSDRNKVSENSYLKLKNSHGVDRVVVKDEKFKILDISNEAPDYIKTTVIKYGGTKVQNIENDDLWIASLTTSDEIKLNRKQYTSINPGTYEALDIPGVKKLRLKAFNATTKKNYYTRWVVVDNFKQVTGSYGSVSGGFLLRETFGEEANFPQRFVEDGDGRSINTIISELKSDDNSDYVGFEFISEVVENRPEFDGRFFVKIPKYSSSNEELGESVSVERSWTITDKLYIGNLDSHVDADGKNVRALTLNTTNKDYIFGDFDIFDTPVTGSNSPIRSFSDGGEVIPGQNAVNQYQNYTWSSFQKNDKAKTLSGALISDRVATKHYGRSSVDDGFVDAGSIKTGNCQFGETTNEFFEWIEKYVTGGGVAGIVSNLFPDSTQTHGVHLDGFWFRGRIVDGNGVDEVYQENEVTPDGKFYYASEKEQMGDGCRCESVYGTSDVTSGESNVIVLSERYRADQDVNNIYNNAASYLDTPIWEKIKWFNPDDDEIIFGFANDTKDVKYKVKEVKRRLVHNHNEKNTYSSNLNRKRKEVNARALPQPGDGSGTTDGQGPTGGSNPVYVDKCEPVFEKASNLDTSSMARLQCHIVFERLDDIGDPVENSGIDIDVFDPRVQTRHDGTELQVINVYEKSNFKTTTVNNVPSKKPAVWETVPAETTDIDLYYEASSSIPMILNSDNIQQFAPKNSNVTIVNTDSNSLNQFIGIQDYADSAVKLGYGGYEGGTISFNHNDGTVVESKILKIGTINNGTFAEATTSTHVFEADSWSTSSGAITGVSNWQDVEVGSLALYDYEVDNLVLNGSFNDGNANWSEGSGWAIRDGKAFRKGSDFTNNNTSNSAITQSVYLEEGKRYVVSYTREWISGNGETNVYSYISNTSSREQIAKYIKIGFPGKQVVTYYFTAGHSSDMSLSVYGIGDFEGYIYDVTVKEYKEEGPHLISGTRVSAVNSSSGGTVVLDKTPKLSIQTLDVNEVQGVTNKASIKFVKFDGSYLIDKNVYKYKVQLPWFNCYSFGNGVESNSIRDDFNASRIDNGFKVSTTFLQYEEELKHNSLIYSGLYNSLSKVNNINEFNMAEKITKDLNPTYGSIQALHTRNTDLQVFTNDKVLKVLANKDALYNADGNVNVTATNRVLGQAIPYVGDYGVSNDPESIAHDQYRSYFVDKQRGAVLRLSNDGLTPISDIGMKTWFKDNLSVCDKLVGGFDKVNNEYNITIHYNKEVRTNPTTLSFNEAGKGWVSFKSYIPDSMQSISGKFLTSKNGYIWEHYSDDVDRNTFYSDLGPELIENGSFNTDLRGWSFINNRNKAVSQVRVSPSSNKTSALLNGLTRWNQYNGNFYQTLKGKTKMDTKYLVSFEYFIDSGSLRLDINNGTEYDVTLATTGQWLEYSTVFDTSKEPLSSVVFYGLLDSPVVAYITNISVKEIYDNYSPSKLTFIYNESPDLVKNFKNVSYEGSDGKTVLIKNETVQDANGDDVVISLNDPASIYGYEDLDNKGWELLLKTDIQNGKVNGFRNKENKWFGSIVGSENLDDLNKSNIDLSNISVQGLGFASYIVGDDQETVDFNITN